ncbi:MULTISPECIES: carbon-nitrogen hydrolase family protein [Microbulbifer]|uniref:carbon-nitrogen hydrolase family protein n=1 Tax=Microbulbifer TaxID=48073 RepID=UPI001E2F1951|nr:MULTISPECIES: carbon-nitrogen hydrolase family protein [Microbulbifer]UHQ53778.1 carbon-nitrogen hydrolase family protein [Microbulbifer sp. YPW16]
MRDLRIAAIQISSGASVAANLARAGELVRAAAAGGAKMVLLPEYFAHLADGGSAAVAETFASAEADPERQPVQAALQRWARENRLWLVAGAMPLNQRPDGSAVDAGRVRSACLVYDDRGQCRARYDKVHLFDVEVEDAARSYRESAGIEAGDSLQVVETPWGRLGLSICFDLRFPELYRELAARGAEILLVPSAFTHVTGSAHWLTLLRARAIENGCFVVAADQCGQHSPRRRTWGHSVILDPWGDVLAEAGEEETVLAADLHGKRLAEIRRRMPLLDMRRLP